MSKKLIERYSDYDLETFEDAYLFMAASIEDSLNSAGAVPGKDYSRVDLYKLAQPFALEYFKEHGFGRVSASKG